MVHAASDEGGIGMACLGVFALVWVVGYLICRATLGPDWRAVPMALRLGLGWAAGAAAGGMTTFWATALAPGRRAPVIGLAAAVLIALGLARSTRGAGGPASPADPGRDRAIWWLGATAFAAVLAAWLAHGLDLGVGGAAGGWDAWSFWNQRARFLYLCPEEWTRGFEDANLKWAHPEYPVLMPSLVALGWLPAGRCVALAPVGVALMTQAALLLMLVGLAQAADPRSAWPWAFGVYYATIPQEWSQQGAWQYADRPLAAFLLAGAGCLALGLRRRRRAWFYLAGLAWGAAAFTKDEGKAALAILGVGATAAMLVALCRPGRWRAAGGFTLLTLGLAPGVASLALQRHFSPLPSELIGHMTAAPLSDRVRTDLILEALRGRLDHPSAGWLWWGCGLALLTLWPWLRRRELWLLWAIPAAQLLAYLVIFQLTPQPLAWHLDSALPRLLMHVGPLAFLAASWLILEATGSAGE